jgi:hypothetical protein
VSNRDARAFGYPLLGVDPFAGGFGATFGNDISTEVLDPAEDDVVVLVDVRLEILVRERFIDALPPIGAVVHQTILRVILVRIRRVEEQFDVVLRIEPHVRKNWMLGFELEAFLITIVIVTGSTSG